MAYKFPDRVHVTCATTGAGTLMLGSAFAADKRVMPSSVDGHMVDYTIVDGSAWEVGTGVYTHSGATLTRSLISSSTGSLLNLSGSAQVFVTVASATMEALAPGIDTIQAVTSLPTGSNSALITNIPATYRQLMLVLRGVMRVNDPNQTRVRVSTDNGATYFFSDYMVNVIGVDAAVNGRRTDSISTGATTLGAAAVDDRVVLISGYQGGAHVFAESTGYFDATADGGIASGYTSAGTYLGSTAAINALSVTGQGNYSAGTYALYGIR